MENLPLHGGQRGVGSSGAGSARAIPERPPLAMRLGADPDISSKAPSKMSMDDAEVARVLQTYLSEGHTLPESLASLVMCAREGRLTPANKLVTMDAVRAGFKLWHARRSERAALLSVLSSWNAAQRQGAEVHGAEHPVAPAVGRRARSGPAPKRRGRAASQGGTGAASTSCQGLLSGGAALADRGQQSAGAGSTGPQENKAREIIGLASAVVCTQECTEAETSEPAGGTPKKTSMGRRRFPRRPSDAGDAAAKRPRAD